MDLKKILNVNFDNFANMDMGVGHLSTHIHTQSLPGSFLYQQGKPVLNCAISVSAQSYFLWIFSGEEGHIY